MAVQKPKINYIENYILRHIWCLSIFESGELESKYILRVYIRYLVLMSLGLFGDSIII